MNPASSAINIMSPLTYGNKSVMMMISDSLDLQSEVFSHQSFQYRLQSDVNVFFGKHFDLKQGCTILFLEIYLPAEFRWMFFRAVLPSLRFSCRIGLIFDCYRGLFFSPWVNAISPLAISTQGARTKWENLIKMQLAQFYFIIYFLLHLGSIIFKQQLRWFSFADLATVSTSTLGCFAKCIV